MALKGCIKKAGKALDADDRQYMNGLMKKGRSDTEVLNRLEQRVTRERDELVETLEDQGIAVAKVEAEVISEESLASPTEQGTTEGRVEGQRDRAKVSEERSSSSTEGGKQPKSEPLQDRQTSAKPKTKGPGSEFGFGPKGEEGRSRRIDRTDDEAKPSQKDASAAEPLFLTRHTIDEGIAKLSEGSDIIQRFLANGNLKRLFVEQFTNSYFAVEDVVNITGKDPDTNRQFDLNNPEDLAFQRQILEHEITHANTIAYLVRTFMKEGSKQDVTDVEYMLRTISHIEDLPTKGLSDEAVARMGYVLSQESQISKVAEFIAIMGAETDTANEIYDALARQRTSTGKGLRGRIRSFIERIKNWYAKIPAVGLFGVYPQPEKVTAALVRTIEHGTAFREQQYEESRSYTADLDKEFNYNAKTSGINFQRKASFDYLNFAVSSMLNSKLERKGKTILGNLHDIMYDRFPLYQDAADKARGVYNGSPALQQFVHTVTGEGVNKTKKADMLAKFAAINAQRTEIINDQLSQIRTLSKDLTDREKADLDVFISQMPLHDYFIQAGDLATAESIEAEAELLRKELWKINARAVRDVDQLIDWNIDGNLTGTIYNLDAKEYPLQGDFGLKLRKLLALESIKRIGAKKFEKLLKHEELMAVIKDNSVANGLSTFDNEGTANVRDSLVQDYWKEPFQIKAVTKADFRMYEFGEETGWKVLQSPTETELGIVYKPTIDSTDIAGTYTDTKLSSTDVNVSQSMRKMKNVVKSKNGYKLLLTKKQKQDLGLVEEFGVGLVRSAAHSIAINESQIIRDELLQEDTHMTIGKGESISKLETTIESDNIDNPWFIQLDEGTEYAKLPAGIRAKYMPVGNRASNVKGFNDRVDLVRKDISHWLLGGSAKSLFENPHMRWAVRTLKNLVSGAKIGMIVLNPVKIANDNLSNLTYLGVLGLSPTFIASNYKQISTDFAEYSDLQRQIFQAKLQLVSRPESTKIKKHLKSLQKRLAANSVGDIGDKGFVNSLGSDLVSRSADTLSGFQADMHKALEYLLVDSQGNKNYVSQFVMQMQKIGFQAEDFFGYLGDLAGKAKSTKLLQQELDQVAARIREIKSEEDIVNYVAQFTTSPSSEAVRMGSAMTDLTDVLAKETLYRHFVQNMKMKPEDARIKVLDSFPDYKENMPLAVQQLSDVGILMFPSFWLRIQKIIYRMARDKPVGLATELMVQEMLGSDINTIFEANIINKSNTFGGLFHMPFEPVGVGSVVPTHTF